jgi:Mg2+-importing ATPase
MVGNRAASSNTPISTTTTKSGLKNLLDVAVLDYVEMKEHVRLEHRFEKIDELPFDFSRRRMSVVLATEENKHLSICKGAVEEVFAACTHYAWTAM